MDRNNPQSCLSIFSRAARLFLRDHSSAILYHSPLAFFMSLGVWVLSQSKHNRISLMSLNEQTSRAIKLSFISLVILIAMSLPSLSR